MLGVYQILGPANPTSILLQLVSQDKYGVLTCQQVFYTQGSCLNLHINLCKNCCIDLHEIPYVSTYN